MGPVALTANAGLAFEYLDNVNLSSLDKTGDLIIRPSLTLTGVWQVTKLNSLELRSTFEYTKYLEHPDLDSQTALIAPDSEIRLNVFISDIKLVFHEKFSLEEDPVPQGGVSGVAKLGRFTNTVGVTALWDLNDIIWSVGLDHYNFITTGNTANTNGSLNSNLSSLDHSTEQASTAVILKLSPTTKLGLEATAAYSTYPKNSRADSTMYSLGPFLDMQLSRYTHLTLAAGYQIYQSQNGSSPGNAPTFVNDAQLAGAGGALGAPGQPQTSSRGRSNGDGDGYYFSISITHRLNRFYQDRLSASREFQIGLLSDRTETTSISYLSQWTFNRRLSLGTLFFYEDVHETSQFASAFGNGGLGDYQRYGVNLNTSLQLTKKLSATLHYQFTKQTADFDSQNYTQNRIALLFGYQF